MTPLYGHSAVVAEFVSRMIPGSGRGFGTCTAIGIIDDDGKLVAGLVYHNWYPETGVIEMSVAAINKRWITRTVLRAIFAYPFGQLDCQLVVFRVAPADKALRRILKAVGATEHVIPRLRGRNEAEVIITLADDAWKNSKFARNPDGQENSESP